MEGLSGKLSALKQEIGKVIIGQEETVSQLLITFLAGGHALLEGVPGLAKTLMTVMLDKAMSIDALLKFYMGKNTPDRQDFIINNLKVELDLVEENQLQPK